MLRTTKIQHGLTLVELMVTLSVVAAIAGVAVPALSRSIVTHELNNAQEDVATVLRKAKHLARTKNTNIRVTFTQGNNLVELRLPNNVVLQELRLSEVTPDRSITFLFNSIGTVDNVPGTVILISDRDGGSSKSVSINTLFGQITIS